ncbi:hypothetical protein [Mesorhizobium sp.]|nr:hypothetical protein [Mesorhizobium sp.]
MDAIVFDRFQRWSDCNGEPDNAFTMDELITNAMIYCKRCRCRTLTKML